MDGQLGLPLGGAHTLAWFDGFGRTYKSAAAGRTGAIADRVTSLTEFNDRGEIFRSSLPHFAGAVPAEPPKLPVVWITSAYDALDRPVRQTFGDGKFVTIDYAASAEPGAFLAVTTTDELFGKTRVHSDAAGRVVRTDEVGDAGITRTTRSVFDPLGRLTGITDPGGSIFAYGYDSLGRRITVDDPDLGVWRFVYDDLDRLQKRTDARGVVTTFLYDALSRVVRKTVATPGVATPKITTSTWDEPVAGRFNTGRLTTLENDAAVIRYEYVSGGQVFRESTRLKTGGVESGPTWRTLTYWNAAGLVTQRYYPDNDTLIPTTGTAGTISYDYARRLKSLPGLIDDIVYNAAGQALAVDYTNGVRSAFWYHPSRGWVSRIDHLGPTGGVLQRLIYTRDGKGRITAVTSNRPADSWVYSYDDFDQLLSADNAGPAGLLDQSFSYALNGNLLSNSKLGTYAYPVAARRPAARADLGRLEAVHLRRRRQHAVGRVAQHHL